MWIPLSGPSLGLPRLPIIHHSAEVHSGSNDLQTIAQMSGHSSGAQISIILLWGSGMDVGLPLQCWSAAPQPLFRMLLRTHLSPGLFQGNESFVQKWQSPSKQEGKCGPVFQLLLSSLQYFRLIEAFSEDEFCCLQPSFPFPIRNRSLLLWLNSLNSPRGEMWNKRINYFKTKILSSLGIKLESENEKHRRSLAALRRFTEFSPLSDLPLSDFTRVYLWYQWYSDCLKNMLGETEHLWGKKRQKIAMVICGNLCEQIPDSQNFQWSFELMVHKL